MCAYKCTCVWGRRVWGLRGCDHELDVWVKVRGGGGGDHYCLYLVWYPPSLSNSLYSVKCQLSDYVFLRRVPRRTIIAKTSNLHQKVGYRQDYKYRKLHAYTPKTLTVVLSLVQTRKNQLSATGTYYRKLIHRIVSILGSTS